jgi:hypothetical protein
MPCFHGRNLFEGINMNDVSLVKKSDNHGCDDIARLPW